jgi:F-type H+-transporting ATPase subunit b
MLDINLGLLIFTAVVFFALIYFLNSILYQPLLGFMQKREDLIKSDMDNIAENSGDVESSLNKAKTLISDAKSEAAAIRESAITKAKEAAAKELETAQAAIEAKYEAFVQELSADRVALKKDLLANLSSYQNSLQAKLKNI